MGALFCEPLFGYFFFVFFFVWAWCMYALEYPFIFLNENLVSYPKYVCVCEICLNFTFELFFQHFYHVLACMRRPQGRGLELARKHIASCLLELDLIRNSSTFLSNNSVGISKDDLEDMTTASGRQPLGFDSSLNCRLSAPTPPRAIKLLSWKKVRKLDLYCRIDHNRLSYDMVYFPSRQ